MPDPALPATAPASGVASPGRTGAGEGVWAPGRRRLTAGLVLTVTLVAFESMAVSTVMPVVADELGGLGLYGWVFSGFFLGSLLGIVVAGQMADRRGTRLPFVIGLICFVGGLAVGAAAQSMGMLVAGRVAQGFGAGSIPAIAYVCVGRSYPAELRPRVFAVFSTAWVVPGVIGPAAASALADVWSWRAVFAALFPFVAVAAAMTVPALSDRVAPAHGGQDGRDPDTGTTPTGPGYDSHGPAASDGSGAAGAPPARVVEGQEAEVEAPTVPDRRIDALLLVGGVALVLAGLGASSALVGVFLVVVGLVPAGRAFLRLVPVGTLRLAAGIPAAVAVRGILTFAFFGADAYVTLAMTDARGTSTRMGGAALTAATLGWVSGAWMQQRIVGRVGPRWLVRRGFVLIAVGIAGLLVVLTPVPPALSLLFWGIAGLGMGSSYAPLSVTVLGLAEPGQEGRATSSLQLSDVLGVSLGTGLGGVFVALGEDRGWSVGSSLVPVFVMALLVALLGSLAAGRLPRRLPKTSA